MVRINFIDSRSNWNFVNLGFSKGYNPVEEDEENAVKVEIDLSLNKIEVIEKIKNFFSYIFQRKSLIIFSLKVNYQNNY